MQGDPGTQVEGLPLQSIVSFWAFPAHASVPTEVQSLPSGYAAPVKVWVVPPVPGPPSGGAPPEPPEPLAPPEVLVVPPTLGVPPVSGDEVPPLPAIPPLPGEVAPPEAAVAPPLPGATAPPVEVAIPPEFATPPEPGGVPPAPESTSDALKCTSLTPQPRTVVAPSRATDQTSIDHLVTASPRTDIPRAAMVISESRRVAFEISHLFDGVLTP